MRTKRILLLIILGLLVTVAAEAGEIQEFTVGTIPISATSSIEQDNFISIASKNGLKVTIAPNSALVSMLANGEEYGHMVDQIRILNIKKCEITYLYFSNINKLDSNPGSGNEMSFLGFELLNENSLSVYYKMTDGSIGAFLFSVKWKRVISRTDNIASIGSVTYEGNGVFRYIVSAKEISEIVNAIDNGHQPWRLSLKDSVESFFGMKKNSNLFSYHGEYATISENGFKIKLRLSKFKNVYFLNTVYFEPNILMNLT